LIAEAAQPAFRESHWNDAMWGFSRDGHTISDKKILAFPDDQFQFSVANEQSKQDFHLHASVLEIYVSNSPVELVYRKEGVEEALAITSGILIVPPGIAHKIKLHGMTFVFQVALHSGQVHNDKTLVEPSVPPIP